jgi:hypothetical protein
MCLSNKSVMLLTNFYYYSYEWDTCLDKYSRESILTYNYDGIVVNPAFHGHTLNMFIV